MNEDRNPKAAQAAADGKVPLQLIDSAMTHPAARVLASGAEKYGVRNWRKVPINASTYIGALRRHTDEWADGANADADSGEHPLAHIAATCNVVLDAIEHGTLVDDRDYAEARTAFATCPICAIPANCKDGGRCLTRNVVAPPADVLASSYAASDLATPAPKLVCGLALRDDDPASGWVGPGCHSTPCVLADKGCPGLQGSENADESCPDCFVNKDDFTYCSGRCH